MSHRNVSKKEKNDQNDVGTPSQLKQGQPFDDNRSPFSLSLSTNNTLPSFITKPIGFSNSIFVDDQIRGSSSSKPDSLSNFKSSTSGADKLNSIYQSSSLSSPFVSSLDSVPPTFSSNPISDKYPSLGTPTTPGYVNFSPSVSKSFTHNTLSSPPSSTFPYNISRSLNTSLDTPVQTSLPRNFIGSSLMSPQSGINNQLSSFLSSPNSLPTHVSVPFVPGISNHLSPKSNSKSPSFHAFSSVYNNSLNYSNGLSSITKFQNKGILSPPKNPSLKGINSPHTPLNHLNYFNSSLTPGTASNVLSNNSLNPSLNSTPNHSTGSTGSTAPASSTSNPTSTPAPSKPSSTTTSTSVKKSAPPPKPKKPEETVHTGCKCKKSKCLKLYCECFAKQGYCVDCSCTCCMNIPQHEELRQKTIQNILDRDPNAFFRSDPAEETKGCNCKKSSCLKKYCECYQNGLLCGEFCRCIDCKNNLCVEEPIVDGRTRSQRAKITADLGGEPPKKRKLSDYSYDTGQIPVILSNPNTPQFRQQLFQQQMATHSQQLHAIRQTNSLTNPNHNIFSMKPDSHGTNLNGTGLNNGLTGVGNGLSGVGNGLGVGVNNGLGVGSGIGFNSSINLGINNMNLGFNGLNNLNGIGSTIGSTNALSSSISTGMNTRSSFSGSTDSVPDNLGYINQYSYDSNAHANNSDLNASAPSNANAAPAEGPRSSVEFDSPNSSSDLSSHQQKLLHIQYQQQQEYLLHQQLRKKEEEDQSTFIGRRSLRKR